MTPSVPRTPTPLPSAPRLHALIPCGGTGVRAGVGGPKQYHPVAGRPMVAHTLAALARVARLSTVLTVIAADDARFEELLGAQHLIARCAGATRASTVLNGLNALLQRGADVNDWVLVHDAARCLVTPEQINRLIDACLNDAVGGLLAQPLADTLKAEADGRVSATLPRAHKWLAQTPQMFRLGALMQALQQALNTAVQLGGEQVTDEASAMEAMGFAPKLVVGSAQNFKVTYPEDFALAHSLLVARDNSSAGGLVPGSAPASDRQAFASAPLASSEFLSESTSSRAGPTKDTE